MSMRRIMHLDAAYAAYERRNLIDSDCVYAGVLVCKSLINNNICEIMYLWF